MTTIGFSDSAVRTDSIVGNTFVVDPGGRRKTLLREWLALVALLVISVGAVSSVGNTGCSIPLGSLGASIRRVHALFSVEEFPWQTPVTWVGTDALSSVEEGVGRTADVDTRLTIPTFVDWAGRVTTDLLGGQENESGRTDASIN